MGKIRKIREIKKYRDEAYDKLWLMNTRPYENPEVEKDRKKYEQQILAKYDDIPEEGFANGYDWYYWLGVLDTLKWVLGHEKYSSKM